ncbi:uncharacterized protein [Primulina huaijiensis]|uniref:uncharacterized protein n=1 Tax=Primulina huaijiensis TaxID=1492673 RepID=UPI003CC7875F
MQVQRHKPKKICVRIYLIVGAAQYQFSLQHMRENFDFELREENVCWPISTRGWDSGARGWYSVDTNHAGIDCSLNAHTSGSGHVLTPFVSEEQRMRELSLDIQLDATEIVTEPDTTASETDEDERDDENAKFSDIVQSVLPVGPSLYDVPQFFNTIYDEQCPDSVGMSSTSNLSYYNVDKGELCTDMVFKGKKHLITAVNDFSVRVARREYQVVESTKTLWKVRCKNKYSNTNYRWGLRASSKSKLGYIKMTKYGGPHTCMSSHVVLDHHNLDKNMIAQTLTSIVQCNLSCEIKYVIQHIKDRYNYQISYGKA